jgi:hypothetical protein
MIDWNLWLASTWITRSALLGPAVNFRALSGDSRLLMSLDETQLWTVGCA